MKVHIKNYPDEDSISYKLGLYTQQKVDVRIDKWDTWSLDETLAHIIHPALVQLKNSVQGYPGDKELDIDAPINLETDEDRWQWILGEMIFAFKSKLYDWGEEFTSGELDYNIVNDELVKGPNNTFKIDQKAMKECQARITNGFRLFGKYYEHLWD